MKGKDANNKHNEFHPEKPGAVGSRNSKFQEGRDSEKDSSELINDEIEKIINHISKKLPPEVLERLDVMGTIKDKLYNYINKNYVNMINRYLITAEDEMQKKVRDFIDKEEQKNVAKYTPKQIVELLDNLGGMEKFNTESMEKSVTNMYGHMQNHINHGIAELENRTNSILKQNTDVGAFINSDNAYSVVKCSFKDNTRKPKTVYDVKLSINILENELINPIFQYHVTTEFLIKELISQHVITLIDKEVEKLDEELLEEENMDLNETEKLFEKINRIENYTDDETENIESKRYYFIAKNILDMLSEVSAESTPEEFDGLSIRENIKKIIDRENIRNKGFNKAVNALTSILNESKMGYQYAENLKNARMLLIKEYEDINTDVLPDERYEIKLSLYDYEKLEKERRAYDKQIAEFQREIDKVWNVLWTVYERNKKYKQVSDFNDLLNKVQRDILKSKRKTGIDYEFEEEQKVWDEVGYVKPALSEVERNNRTYTYEKSYFKNKIKIMKDKLESIFAYQNPIERAVLEERLVFLEEKYEEFDHIINPYHIQPGLLLDIDITSIKKKKTSLVGMSTVLQEFLKRTSKGFTDKTFNEFMSKHAQQRIEQEEEYITADYEYYQDENSSFEQRKDKPAPVEAVVDLSPKSTKNGDISIEIEDLD